MDDLSKWFTALKAHRWYMFPISDSEDGEGFLHVALGKDFLEFRNKCIDAGIYRLRGGSIQISYDKCTAFVGKLKTDPCQRKTPWDLQYYIGADSRRFGGKLRYFIHKGTKRMDYKTAEAAIKADNEGRFLSNSLVVLPATAVTPRSTATTTATTATPTTTAADEFSFETTPRSTATTAATTPTTVVQDFFGPSFTTCNDPSSEIYFAHSMHDSNRDNEDDDESETEDDESETDDDELSNDALSSGGNYPVDYWVQVAGCLDFSLRDADGNRPSRDGSEAGIPLLKRSNMTAADKLEVVSMAQGYEFWMSMHCHDDQTLPPSREAFYAACVKVIAYDKGYQSAKQGETQVMNWIKGFGQPNIPDRNKIP